MDTDQFPSPEEVSGFILLYASVLKMYRDSMKSAGFSANQAFALMLNAQQSFIKAVVAEVVEQIAKEDQNGSS